MFVATRCSKTTSPSWIKGVFIFGSNTIMFVEVVVPVALARVLGKTGAVAGVVAGLI